MRARGTILRKYEMFGWRLVFDSNHWFSSSSVPIAMFMNLAALIKQRKQN